jgi:hypothetical protein
MTKLRDPGDVKPGWTTSEFWQTLLVHAIAAVVALGTVFHTHFDLNGFQAVVPAVALFSSAVAQSVYSHSRAIVKQSAQAAGAQVRSAGMAASSGSGVGPEPAPITIRLTGAQPAPAQTGDRNPPYCRSLGRHEANRLPVAGSSRPL